MINLLVFNGKYNFVIAALTFLDSKKMKLEEIAATLFSLPCMTLNGR